MARTNKYNSLNFNDIYEKQKKINTNNNNSTTPSSSSSSKTLISNSRIHGNMLVLTRPSPKPIVPSRRPSPPPPPATVTTQPPPDQAQPPVEPESISLRPLGRTGSAQPPVSHHHPALHRIQGKDLSDLPKTNRFVPPHLRPGFHGREEKPEPEVLKQTGFGMRSGNIRQGLLGDPVGEEGRPKSGGGFERNRMGMNRPGSSGSGRPYSSG